MEIAIFIGIIIGVLSLMANVMLAGRFNELAQKKGHNIENYWLFWLFCSLFLYLYVMALPTLTHTEHKDELPQI